eukprot:9126727-Alexandrium_andersonii.AAC.1
MAILRRSCLPWHKLRKYLQAHAHLVANDGAGSLAHLVWGEGQAIFDKVAALTKFHAWQNVLTTAPD